MHAKRTSRHGKTRRRKHSITKKHSKSKGKKWQTAIHAASERYKKTGNLIKARLAFRAQALANARKLFGSVGETK